MSTNEALHLAADLLARIADSVPSGTLPGDFDAVYDAVCVARDGDSTERRIEGLYAGL